MTDWESPLMIARVFDVAKVFAWLSGGMVFYHDITFMPFDYSILVGQRARRWPQIFYFSIKVVWWIYFFLNMGMIYSIKKPGDCQILTDAVEVSMGLICTFASVLLGCRTVCVYQGKARSVISGVLTVGILAVFATWMSGAGDVTAVWVPKGGNPWQEGGCNYAKVATSYPAKYVMTVAYDLMVLVLTIVGVIRMQGGSRLGSILMSQGVAYFSMTAAAYLVVTVLCFLQLSPLMTLIGAIPSSAIAVMASTRLYVDLAEAARPGKSSSYHGNHVESSELSNGTGEKVASYFKRSARVGGSNSPVKNEFNLPYQSRSQLQPNSASDLESQSGSSSDNSLGRKAGNTMSLHLTSPATTEQAFSRQHPYAAAASGLPIYPSQTPPKTAITQESALPQSNGVTSGQKLAIAVERSCEVTSAIVPSDINFVAPANIRESQEYPGLRRKSN